MKKRLQKIEEQIDKVKSELMKIRTMRPGLVSRQYKDRRARTGSYYQISYTHHMRSRTEYISAGFVADVRQQTAEYDRFKKLIDIWVRLAIEHARLTTKLAKERTVPMSRPEKTNTIPEQITVRVTLCDIEPPIWRSIKMTNEMTLDQLHYAIQGAFGWQNSHLHAFEIRGEQRYSSNEVSISEGEEEDSRKVTLGSLTEKNVSDFMYEYDFGDSWHHLVTIEDVKPLNSPAMFPECLDGARHCPPEDCGGVPGFENFLEVMKDRKHPEHKEMMEWFGGKFDPEKFSKREANEEIKAFLKFAGTGAFQL